MAFGFFVQIKDKKTGFRRDGLVHISQIRNGVRINKPEESGYQEKDKVFVKLTEIKEGNKLSLSMKEVD